MARIVAVPCRYRPSCETHQAAAADADATSRAGERILARMRWFRADLYAAVTDPQHPGVLEAIVGWADEIAPARTLEVDGDALRPVVVPEHPRDLPRVAVIAAAVDFLVDDHPRVGSCPGTGCGWVFADTTGRRKWCSMDVCGNRAKVAAHADRQRG